MRRIQKYPIASMIAGEITSADLIDMVRERNKTVLPSTAANDLIWISTVFKVARPALRVQVSLEAVRDAQTICYKEGLTGKSRQRNRRPTVLEMSLLMEYFASMPRSVIPYCDLYLFLLFSGRRDSEMCRILWTDVDEQNKSVLVQDMKHPTKKWGNHRRVSIPDRAWAILIRQKRQKSEDRIFPFNPRTVSSTFTKACRFIGIDDLRLYEAGRELLL